jgi:hypothetical protein
MKHQLTQALDIDNVLVITAKEAIDNADFAVAYPIHLEKG